ncbi:hypothetical protein F895_02360 [Acinetobacter sp. CIP 64.2]|nr:hypothetical protein F895_02360 [Acinetobacter sp. CIP 64.2]
MTEVEITLNRAIPKSLAVLSNEVGNEAISILHYLREHKESIFALLPHWSDEVLALLDEVERKEPLLETMHEPVELPAEKKSYRLFPFLTLIFASFSLLFLYHITK